MAKGQPVNKGLLVVLIVAVVVGGGILLMQRVGSSKDPEVKTVAAPPDLKPITKEEMANGPQPMELR